MDFRTDLALERREILQGKTPPGVLSKTEEYGDITVTSIEITDTEGERLLGKPKGKYITAEVPPFSDDAEIFDERLDVLARELRSLLPEEGTVLVVGLGNTEITPDALGPKSAGHVLATRHIGEELARDVGLGKLRSVCTFSPGVLGKTGIETAEMISGIAGTVKPSAVIVIDALASRSLSRLGCTVQISDSGIEPGSGVGNRRARIDGNTLGAKVISVGVPTVVDGATLAYDLISDNTAGSDESRIRSMISLSGERMIVTPKDIDLLIDRASKLVGMAINAALQTDLTKEDILALA